MILLKKIKIKNFLIINYILFVKYNKSNLLKININIFNK